jgi:four helix bundle protein
MRSDGCVLQRVAGVRRFEELDAWKLCTELDTLVCGLADEEFRRRDRALHMQLRRSASSAPALIAEGWGRFNPADFANYVRMAKGSLNETKSHLHSARRKDLIMEPAFLDALNLFHRAVGAASALGRYLRSPEAQRFLKAAKTLEP